MFKQKSLITSYCLAAVVVLALLGPLAQNGRGDFVLLGDEQLTVYSYHHQGTLFDTSQAFIVSGGSVDWLFAYNFSTVNMSDGGTEKIYAYNSSTVNMSDGGTEAIYAYNSSTVNMSYGCVDEYLWAHDSSNVNISGGNVDYLGADDSSTVNISGGHMFGLGALNSSVVTFHGRNFRGSGGLILYGDSVLSTGTLSGEWFDGTQWWVTIGHLDPTATIRAIPEPATLLLLGLGAVMLRKRR